MSTLPFYRWSRLLPPQAVADSTPATAAAPAWVCDRGQGEHFKASLARVLTTRRDAPPPMVRELELTWRFSVSPKPRHVPRVEHGCSARGDVPVCATMVHESEVFAVAQRETALSVTVGFMAGDG